MKTDHRCPILRFSAILCVLAAAALVPVAAVGETHLTTTELAMWNSPEFQKRFLENSLPETDVEPRITQPERDTLEKVLKFTQNDKVDEAVRLLEKETKPASSAVFDFMLGTLYLMQTERSQEAIAAFDRAVDKKDNYLRAWKNLAWAYARDKEYAKSLPALTKVVELGGADRYTYGMLGVAYASTGDYLCAESAYRQAILLDPGNPDWKKGLAYSLFQQKRHAETVSLCDAWIANDPERGEMWLMQANAYIGLGEPLKAAVNCEILDRMGQSTISSLNLLADIYVNQELFDLAVGAYVRALEMDPNSSPDRAIRAAKVLTSHGATAETKQLVEKIETLRGNSLSKDEHRDMLMLRMRIAVAEQSGEEEAKMLEQLVSLDPLDGESLILLGQYCARSGDTEKAVFYYERAESLEKYEADAKIRHAQLLVNQEKYTEALPLLRRAQDLKPRDDVQKYLEQVERRAKTR